MKRFFFFLSFIVTVKINIWYSSIFIFVLWFIFIKGFFFEENIKPKDNENNSAQSTDEVLDSDFGKSQNQIDPVAGCFQYVLFPLTGGYVLGFILKAYNSPGWEWVKELFSVHPM